MIKTNVKLPYDYSAEDLSFALMAILPIEKSEILGVEIIKLSLNISDKSDIHYDATLAVDFSPEREAGLLKMKKKVSKYERFSLEIPEYYGARPVIVGAGPAGLFAALTLALSGARPILYERGLDVNARTKKVDSFKKFGILDTECNVQYGEGGAGTFSDGKLKVGSMDKYKHFVLSTFVEAGAPESILYTVGAHLGTDKLSLIVKELREKIISLGGEVRFSSRLVSLDVKNSRIVGGTVKTEFGEEKFETDTLVLATGHSAKDVFLMLRDVGVPMCARGFGIGLRIEHPREYVDDMVYGKDRPKSLGAASYHLVTHLDTGRSVYSFCMCPGGEVVAAASEEGGIVTNGMSEYSRSADNSNAAFLVSVTPDDFRTDDVLAGIELQREIESGAYSILGGYKAPVFRMESFMGDEETSAVLSVNPSYPVGYGSVSPTKYLPSYITDSLKQGIRDFDDWMCGFYYPDSILCGPETRSTSPIKVLRGEDFSTVGIIGLYPAGEGAGYSGGIISSARDGVMVAESIIESHKRQ